MESVVIGDEGEILDECVAMLPVGEPRDSEGVEHSGEDQVGVLDHLGAGD